MNVILLVILLAAAWLFYDTAPFITFILGIVAVLTLLASAPQNTRKHSSTIKQHDHDMSGVENLFTRLMEIISIPFKIFFRLFKIPKKGGGHHADATYEIHIKKDDH